MSDVERYELHSEICVKNLFRIEGHTPFRRNNKLIPLLIKSNGNKYSFLFNYFWFNFLYVFYHHDKHVL